MQRTALDWLRKKEANGEIPTNLRFLFYELEQAGEVSKNTVKLDGTPGKRKPSADLTSAVTHLRNIGLIPWDWIVDESRHIQSWNYGRTVLDCVLENVDYSSLDRFPDVPRPVLLCESRAIGGVLERTVALEYLVTVIPTGGQANGFLRTQAARQLAEFLKEGEVLPLYIGDHDDAGNDIEANTRRVLEHACQHTFDNWERLMLTDEQCRMLKRRGVQPIEKTDKRYKDGNPHLAYEAEALGQKLVTQIVRDRLEALAPVPLDEIQEREKEQIEEVKKLLTTKGKKR